MVENNSSYFIFSQKITNEVLFTQSQIQAIPQGIKNSDGQVVVSLGLIVNTLESSFKAKGMSVNVAPNASILAVQTLAGLRATTPQGSVFNAIRRSLKKNFPQEQRVINQLSDGDLALALTGTASQILLSAGLNVNDAQTLEQKAIEVFNQLPSTTSFNQTTEQMQRTIITQLSSTLVNSLFEGLNNELTRMRSSQESQIQPEQELIFEYVLKNTGITSANLEIPTAQTLQNTGLTGEATVMKVTYKSIDENGQSIVTETTNIAKETIIKSGKEITLYIKVKLANFDGKQISSVGISLEAGCGGIGTKQQFTLLPVVDTPLVDPFGRITGCAGEILSDYRGFSVALYDADLSDPTGGISNLTRLTISELPDNPNNNIPLGIAPNIENSNPFNLTNQDRGVYNFFFDQNQGQLDKGRTYILLINPPQDSIYQQRRIKLVIGDRNGDVMNYRATSLDGKPISTTEGKNAVDATITVRDAATFGLSLGILNLNSSLCESQEVSITKTGDRAAAEQGIQYFIV